MIKKKDLIFNKLAGRKKVNYVNQINVITIEENLK